MWNRSLVFASLFLSATCSSMLPRDSKACTTFEVPKDNYTTSAADGHRISVGVTCPNAGATCPIVANGTITEASTIDPNVSSSTRDDLFKLIGSTLNQRLEKSVTDRVANNNAVFQLPPGESGYVMFTSYLECQNGTVNGCGAGYEIQNGTLVTLCTPYHDQTGALGGIMNVVKTDEQSAANMTTNPAATSGTAKTLGWKGDWWMMSVSAGAILMLLQ